MHSNSLKGLPLRFKKMTLDEQSISEQESELGSRRKDSGIKISKVRSMAVRNPQTAQNIFSDVLTSCSESSHLSEDHEIEKLLAIPDETFSDRYKKDPFFKKKVDLRVTKYKKQVQAMEHTIIEYGQDSETEEAPRTLSSSRRQKKYSLSQLYEKFAICFSEK